MPVSPARDLAVEDRLRRKRQWVSFVDTGGTLSARILSGAAWTYITGFIEVKLTSNLLVKHNCALACGAWLRINSLGLELDLIRPTLQRLIQDASGQFALRR